MDENERGRTAQGLASDARPSLDRQLALGPSVVVVTFLTLHCHASLRLQRNACRAYVDSLGGHAPSVILSFHVRMNE